MSEIQPFVLSRCFYGPLFFFLSPPRIFAFLRSSFIIQLQVHFCTQLHSQDSVHWTRKSNDIHEVTFFSIALFQKLYLQCGFNMQSSVRKPQCFCTLLDHVLRTSFKMRQMKKRVGQRCWIYMIAGLYYWKKKNSSNIVTYDAQIANKFYIHRVSKTCHIYVFINSVKPCLITSAKEVMFLSLIHISEPTRPY